MPTTPALYRRAAFSHCSCPIDLKSALLDNIMITIIIRRALPKRWCWNWQTGMVEGHVSQDVEVQVLSSAPNPVKIPDHVRGFFISLCRARCHLALHIFNNQTATGDRAFGFCQFIHNDRFDLIAARREFCACLWERDGEDDRIADWQTICSERF